MTKTTAKTTLSHQKAIEVIKIFLEAHRQTNIALYDEWQTQKFYHEKFATMEDRLKNIIRNTPCDCEVERETTETIPLTEAVESLADGHTAVTPKYAWQICQALGIPYKTTWEYHGFTTFDGGFNMGGGMEGNVTVDLGMISNYAVSYFKLEAGSYIGRGFQAQANSKALTKHFSLTLKEE